MEDHKTTVGFICFIITDTHRYHYARWKKSLWQKQTKEKSQRNAILRESKRNNNNKKKAPFTTTFFFPILHNSTLQQRQITHSRKMQKHFGILLGIPPLCTDTDTHMHPHTHTLSGYLNWKQTRPDVAGRFASTLNRFTLLLISTNYWGCSWNTKY